MSDDETQGQGEAATRPVAERPIQDIAWHERAVALAGDAPLPVEDLGERVRDDLGAVRGYAVPSARTGNLYAVERVEASGEWYCACPAGTYGRACKHVGSVLVARAREQQAKRSGHDCHACDGVGIKGFDGWMAEDDGEACAACGGTGWVWDDEAGN